MLAKRYLYSILGVAGLAALVLGTMRSDSFSPTGPSPVPIPHTPEAQRAEVVNAALREVGSGDAQKYWDVSAPGVAIGKGISWCGGFALWALKQAGLATNVFWEFGKGFLYKLPTTKNPQPGDIAYLTKNQHHAVVSSTNADGSVNLINGNGAGGKVSLSTTPRSSIAAFYSIDPLLTA